MMRRGAQVCTRRLVAAASRRGFNFASTQYDQCFGDLPEASRPELTKKTLDYLAAFKQQDWYDHPVQTIVNGEVVPGGETVDTIDAMGVVNGKQILSTPEGVAAILKHHKSFKGGKDYREQVRKVEKVFEGELAGHIIGNQARDFHKQDGITEIEESVQANEVERRLNDLLAQEESAGNVVVSRECAFVGCVSNFSNFLDLFRKVIRNIELGVPVIVLSRNNTTQHMYRWTVLLTDLLKQHGVPTGLVTYASCDRKSKQQLMDALPDSPSYFTCSRAVASSLIKHSPHLMSSTEGPNTLIATEMTEGIAEATKLSNLIENKGQCTALRHAVIPGATEANVKALYDGVRQCKVEDSIADGEFANILSGHPTSVDQPPPGYKTHPTLPVAYKVASTLPGKDLEEKWRQLYIDVTSPPNGYTDSFVQELSAWLISHQPISCALNAPYPLALRVFDGTGLVVYTVGYPDKAAFTCQARPQDGECFGEFPPRAQLREFTKFPVHIPSATPGYHATYGREYLEKSADRAAATGHEALLNLATDKVARGYLVVLLEYLADVCQQNPKRGKTGPRTALYGLQRPPIGAGETVVRIGKNTNLSCALAYIVPLAATNAKSDLVVSISPDCEHGAALSAALSCVVTESDESFADRARNAYNAVSPAGDTPSIHPTEYPMAAQWVSTLLPLGHVKSVRQNDDEFVSFFRKAKKWLQMA